MKTILILGITLLPTFSFCQQFDKDFDSANIRYLLVANIQGDIKIKGEDTHKISIHTKQEYKNKVNNDDAKVAYIQSGDTLALYIASSCTQFSLNKSETNGDNRWGYYNWDHCREQTSLKVDFEITVPNHIYTILSTINDGDINAEKLNANIWANNINGAINLKNVADISNARTINGNVDIIFDAVPKNPGSFYTLNGDINASFPKNLNADVSFKTFQGDFYTNFKNANTKPAEIEKNTKNNGFTYKLGGKSNIQINSGGVNLDFETFNGNVYLRTI